jgi:hypothetical protein
MIPSVLPLLRFPCRRNGCSVTVWRRSEVSLQAGIGPCGVTGARPVLEATELVGYSRTATEDDKGKSGEVKKFM